jgi:drug/metabolite transporter (DMT)-like permease
MIKIKSGRLLYICLFFSISFMTMSQILLKFSANDVLHKSNIISAYIYNYFFFASLFSAGLGFIFWIILLKNKPVASVYPWTSLIYVFSALGGSYFFNEKINSAYWFSIILIYVGVWLATMQDKNEEY